MELVAVELVAVAQQHAQQARHNAQQARHNALKAQRHNRLQLLYLRRHLVAQALVACQVSLGRAEREEHIQTDGKVVLIVGDVEADEFVVLAVFTLYEREDQTTELSIAILHLHIGDTIVFQPRVGNL